MPSLYHDASTITPSSYIEKAYVTAFKHLPEHIVVPLLFIAGVLFDTVSTLYVTSHNAIGELNPITALVLSTSGWVGMILAKILVTIAFLVVVRLVLHENRLTWYYIATAFFGVFWLVYGIWNVVVYISV